MFIFDYFALRDSNFPNAFIAWEHSPSRTMQSSRSSYFYWLRSSAESERTKKTRANEIQSSWPNAHYFCECDHSYRPRSAPEYARDARPEQWNQWMKHKCIDKARNNNNENKTRKQLWKKKGSTRLKWQWLPALALRRQQQQQQREWTLWSGTWTDVNVFGCAWKIVVYGWNWRWMKTTTSAAAARGTKRRTRNALACVVTARRKLRCGVICARSLNWIGTRCECSMKPVANSPSAPIRHKANKENRSGSKMHPGRQGN